MIYDTRQKWKMLTDLWLSAEGLGEKVIECPDYPTAFKLRRELYAVVRRARKERTRDEHLVKVSTGLAITIRNNDVVIYSRNLSTTTKKLLEVVEKDTTESSLSRLQNILDKVKLPPKPRVITPVCEEGEEGCDIPKNPYFTRED